MTNKPFSSFNNPSENTACPITDEIKQQNFKYSLSKFERDLYYDEDNVVNKIIRVRRFTYPNNGEKWKIFEDNKIRFIVDGEKLTIREKEFLRSVEGINFLIARYKEGLEYITHLKNKIREYFKTIDK